MDRQAFLNRLASRPHILDGAMGTLLHEQGAPTSEGFDAVTLTTPALVKEIHRQYVRAGANIIETNTFGANRFKLIQYGLAGQVHGLNQRAVQLAREAITEENSSVLLAGSIGPLGVSLAPLGRMSAAEAIEAFSEQVIALTDADATNPSGFDVDLLVLETLSNLDEIALAVRAARSVAPHKPIIGMVAFTRDDRTILGESAEEAAGILADLDLDVIGVNCSAGPVQVLRLISIFREHVPEKPLAAMPNAGWPQQMEGGRVLYPATPEYFGRYAQAYVQAGVRIVGGCCGSTPRHIEAMRVAIDNPEMIAEPIPTARQTVKPIPRRASTKPSPTDLARKLAEGRFVVTVEMNPPRSAVVHRLLAGARAMRNAGAEFINVADSPLARMRMGAWAAAHLVQSEVGMESVLHFPTRGRNLLRIQGDLLAAHALNIRNLFVVMGDPTHIGDYPEAMDDYDIVPTGLVKLIKGRLNMGFDQGGREIGSPTDFTVGCAVNPGAANPDAESRLLLKKIRSGADFLITQPIFDPNLIRSFRKNFDDNYEVPLIPIVAGIQPLYNSGNAEFLHNEVPGISIPESLRERMAAAADPQREGVVIARELLEEIRPLVQGVYMIPVFGRFDLAAEALEVVSEA